MPNVLLAQVGEKYKKFIFFSQISRWDGAFSLARTVNPTDEDRFLYTHFVNAAFNQHVNTQSAFNAVPCTLPNEDGTWRFG